MLTLLIILAYVNIRKYAYKRKEDNMMKVKAADDKKVLKKQRIKTYFLEAAKEIIMNDGVENISVRKVADIAGTLLPPFIITFQTLMSFCGKELIMKIGIIVHSKKSF
jgi:hypothetical protein